MTPFRKRSFLLLTLAVFFASVASADEDFSTTPTLNNGKKWRIGCYQGGEFSDYQQSLLATVNALAELGWLAPVRISENDLKNSLRTWQWLSGNAESDYIQFVQDAFYTANWKEDIRKQIADQLITRLTQKKDIDLMLSLGTWAGQDLANNRHNTPVLCMSVSDPLKAGIIKSIEDSGFDHVIARADPNRYYRQIRVFHKIIGFKTLGVCYEDSPRTKTYSALEELNTLSKELNFALIRCYSIDETPDINIAVESVKQCFHELARKADAIYVTAQNGVNPQSIPMLSKIAISYKTPTFAQFGGAEPIKSGFLMGFSKINFKHIGFFYAETVAKIFNGATPRRLNQVYESPENIALNITTAYHIGFDPPLDVLASAKEIFE